MEIDRPAVSLVMPFLGSSSDASAALDALSGLRLRDGDELIVADNTIDGVFAQAAARRGGIDVHVVPATGERSAYYARNVAAERARSEWLLFVDADCLLPPALVDAHLAPPPAERVGAQAGRIVPAAGQASVMARWAASRDVLSQEQSLALPGGPAAATANLLVRRAAWAEVGGFHEGSSLGAEFEFCWRLADAGWEIAWRPEACVEHLHRESLRAVIRQFAMYAAGDAWLNRRRPGAVPRQRVGRSLARAVAAAPAFALSGQFERAQMKAIDAVVVVAQGFGYLGGNAAPRAPSPFASGAAPGIVIATDYFPVLTEQFVTREIAALSAAGRRVRVEAVARPERPLEGGARELEVNWLEDEGTIERAVAMVRLALRHPLRCAADMRARRRLDPDERMPLRALAPAARRTERRRDVHVHVHFAALAAASWLRIGRLAGVPVSVTPHAHDVYAEPRSVVEKLRSASFVTTVCAYNVERLREMVPSPARGRIHHLPIGVDTDRIRRSGPPANGRTVLAVGRLVAQKGFRHLIEAAALLEGEEPLDALVIVGGGPLHDELARLAADLGVGRRVELTGPLDPSSVRAQMQRADLLAMPAVIAADGNRDAVPVVVLEALAMELPVVASDEVGLPEVVTPDWGRLVPPGDAAALASAISELLGLSPQRRAAMGAAGRAFVREHRDPRRQALRLIELIDAAR
jgi:glycosyltransferase involved in cell wall biosynthesis/GT2 family glycosyltransferase